MQLLYPLGLLALAGLVVPLIIHLWNIKKKKTIKIGSIAFLTESARTNAKNLRITDWLLYLLRSLLLFLLAIFIAQPNFVKKQNEHQKVGWILIAPKSINLTLKQHQKLIDSLIKVGYQLHYFAKDFGEFSLDEKLELPESTLNYTSLLNQLNAQIPSKTDVYLFADQRLVNFSEKLPTISYQLHWKTVRSPDTLSTWTSELTGKKYISKSTPSLTGYQNITKGMPKITVTLSDNSIDANYLRAALLAIGDFTGRDIIVSRFDKSKNNQAEVGFWLSEKKIDTDFEASIKSSGSLFSYEKGKIADEEAKLNLGIENSQIVNLRKRIEVSGKANKVLWSDSFGYPILTSNKNSALTRYYFYSRFNIGWTDLVWHEQFLQALLPIVIKDENFNEFGFENHPSDQRIVPPKQELAIAGASSITATTSTSYSIANFFWIIAFLVLVVERILTFSKERDNVKG